MPPLSLSICNTWGPLTASTQHLPWDMALWIYNTDILYLPSWGHFWFRENPDTLPQFMRKSWYTMIFFMYLIILILCHNGFSLSFWKNPDTDGPLFLYEIFYIPRNVMGPQCLNRELRYSMLPGWSLTSIQICLVPKARMSRDFQTSQT